MIKSIKFKELKKKDGYFLFNNKKYEFGDEEKLFEDFININNIKYYYDEELDTTLYKINNEKDLKIFLNNLQLLIEKSGIYFFNSINDFSNINIDNIKYPIYLSTLNNNKVIDMKLKDDNNFNELLFYNIYDNYNDIINEIEKIEKGE